MQQPQMTMSNTSAEFAKEDKAKINIASIRISYRHHGLTPPKWPTRTSTQPLTPSSRSIIIKQLNIWLE
jgi:hypothetical protein